MQLFMGSGRVMLLGRQNKGCQKTAEGPQDVVAWVDEILNRAISCGASDVHFDPTVSELLVKFRLDGVLEVVERLPKILADNVIARLKVLGGLLTYRNDIPQEGRIEIKTQTDGVLDERLAVFPTINGQRAVVRLFYQHKELAHLEQLGFSNYLYEKLKAIAAQSQGILLLTGPAGSGKSTTSAAMLRYILNSSPGKSIVSLEDPVEIRIDSVTQVQITAYGGMDFPTALRSLLRQDPQVLMIGEIRDAQTARIAVEAGLTGHFLMSTMHSGTPAAGFLRPALPSASRHHVTPAPPSRPENDHPAGPTARDVATGAAPPGTGSAGPQLERDFPRAANLSRFSVWDPLGRLVRQRPSC